MKHLSPLLLLVAILLIPIAHGQKKKEVKISFKVTMFNPDDLPSPEVSTVSGVKFKVPMHNISDQIEATLREGKYLDLIQSGKKMPIEISASKRKKLLLIFFPKKHGYAVMQVHAPTTKIGGGDRLLVNATGATLGIKYGKQKPIVLTRGKRVVLKSKSRSAMTTFSISGRIGEEWKLLRSEKWPNDRRFRSFVFIYKKPGSKRIYIHAVPDRIQTPQ